MINSYTVSDIKSGSKKSAAFSFGKMNSPILVEVKNPDYVQRVFGKFPIVPYAGDGMVNRHGLLHFLNRLPYMSPTYGACKQSIKSHLFSGGVELFNANGERASDLEIDRNKEFLESCGIDYLKIGEAMNDDYNDNGNIYLELVVTESLGEKVCRVNVIRSEDVYCLSMKPNKQYLITPFLELTHMNKYGYKVLPEYPNWENEEDGVYRCILHYKVGRFEWYGRPDNLPAHLNGYREYQDMDYRSKIADRQFMPQVFMELTEDDPVQDSPFKAMVDSANESYDPNYKNDALPPKFKSVIEVVNEKFTVAGDDPNSVIAITKPTGAENAFIHEFQIHTRESYYKFEDDVSRRNIIQCHEWSEILLGNHKSTGFSLKPYVEDLKVRDAGILGYRRNVYETLLGKVVGIFSRIKNFDGALNFKYKGVTEKLEGNSEKLEKLSKSAKIYFDAVRFGSLDRNKDFEEHYIQKITEWTQ